MFLVSMKTYEILSVSNKLVTLNLINFILPIYISTLNNLLIYGNIISNYVKILHIDKGEY